jgi:hypothetical protein
MMDEGNPGWRPTTHVGHWSSMSRRLLALVTFGGVCGATIATSSIASAAPAVFLAPENYIDYNAGSVGQVTAQWDSPIVGRSSTEMLDLITRLGGPACLAPSDVPSGDLCDAGWGCIGQCVELTSRWLSRYVNGDLANDSDGWIRGDGGSGYCDCASGAAGCPGPAIPSLYEVHRPGDRTTPRVGDVLSYSYTHASVVLHVWADAGGMHIESANQNQAFVNHEDWFGDHFGSESCLVHGINMPTFQRPPIYPHDLDGDGRGDVCARTVDGMVCNLSTSTGFGPDIAGPAWSDKNGWASPKYHSTIQLPDIDGDGHADLCARSGAGIVCNKWTGSGFGPEIAGPAWKDTDGWGAIHYYGTIHFPDIDGDGKADVCARDHAGITCYLSTGNGFSTTEIRGPAWGDSTDWDQAPYVSTIQWGDVNGDGKADVCGRGSGGVECWLSDGKSFPTRVAGPGWSDAGGWGRDYHYLTIQLGDVDGDHKSDLCARAGAGIVCTLSTGTGFGSEIAGPAWSNDKGWIAPRYFSTIQLLDVDGDERLDVCGRAGDGMHCALWTGAGFGPDIVGPAWKDGDGFVDAQHFTTVMPMDVNHDGKADLCARGKSGFTCAASKGNAFDAPFAGPAWADDKGWNSYSHYGTIRVAGITKKPPPPPLPGSDAGTDGGLADAGTGIDAGHADGSTNDLNGDNAMNGSCGCESPGRAPGTSWFGLGVAALALVACRKRSAHSKQSKPPFPLPNR